MEQLQPIIDFLADFLPHIFAMLSEVGIFFYVKLYLKKKTDELTLSKELTDVKEQLQVLTSDNAQLRKQNKELIDRATNVQNGSDYL